jgi:hypothetical protein
MGNEKSVTVCDGDADGVALTVASQLIVRAERDDAAACRTCRKCKYS